MQNARRATQALFLLLFVFLFLQTESKGNDQLGYPVKIFLDFDPLVFVTTLLASHEVPLKMLYLSIIVVIATLMLGRVFCGWVCPLGTLNNMAGSIARRKRPVIPLGWFRLKYLILIFLLLSSLFSLQLTGVLDPISLLIRSLSVSIYPAFNYASNAAFGTLYDADLPVITGVSESIYGIIKDPVLAFTQPYYRQGLLIGALFTAILGLNLIERRFWCRYLCPLGAMLGLLSKRSLLKRSVSEGCTECGKCNLVCQSNAVPHMKDQWKSTECLYCFNCDDVCPENAVSFGFGKSQKPMALDLGRRNVMISVLSGAAVVPILRATPFSKTTNPLLIRPPGALEEGEFLERCVRCGECMKVCLTNGLQPTLLEAGLEGIWSPLLVPRLGYCEYRCTLCGQVCPTGAIKKLTLKEKAETKIGLAMVDKGRCLPWAHATPCIVCEEVCPTPKKAVWFEESEALDRKGKKSVLKKPHVDLRLCIGCGICEAKCPVNDRPAIYVTSIGESRSSKNQLLL